MEKENILLNIITSW